MQKAFRRSADLLYLACVAIAGFALVAMTGGMSWGVYTRYVLNSADSWPEPMAVLLMILFTFFAGAACYRAGIHISVGLVIGALPPNLRRYAAWVEEGLMALVAVFTIVWGFGLVEVTWDETIAAFPWLPVGVTYLPIPLGGIVTLIFVFERVWLGPPPAGSVVYREPGEAN